MHAATRTSMALGEAVKVIPVGDLGGAIDWAPHLEGIDAVIHLAALAHVTSIIPEADYDRINYRAAAHLARAADAAGARLIFLSSVAAQSGPSSSSVLTETSPPQPTTAYGRAKLRAEQDIAEIMRRYVILRPTLTYGAGVIGNMGRIIDLATLRMPPPFGSIHNQRSLLAVENMCDAVEFVIGSDAALNQLFLLSDPEPVSIAEIVSLIRSGAGLSPHGLRVPPALLAGALHLLRRGELWEKIAGDLVVSVDKLAGLGFKWRTNTQDALRALGARRSVDVAESVAVQGELKSRATAVH